MSFVLFFRGMMSVLVVFAVSIYILTGSLWTAVWQTIVCAILLQIGYFIGILFLIWRQSDKASQAPRSVSDAEDFARPDEPSVDSVGKLTGSTFSHRS